MIQTLPYPVHPALREFIRHIVIDEFYSDAPVEGYSGLYPPTPQHIMLFYLGDSIRARIGRQGVARPYGRLVVVGPQVQCVEVSVPRWQRVLVIRFQPGGLFRLLGLPMCDIVDAGIPGADLLGSDADALVERIRNIPDNAEVCRHVEAYLLGRIGRLQRRLPLDDALEQTWKLNGSLSVDHLASLACLSTRQFERRCLERIGMSPKLYLRITRFSHAYRLYEANPHFNWTDIAHHSGYYDQMHFIRDFKAFTGLTPTAVEKQLAATPVRLQADIRL